MSRSGANYLLAGTVPGSVMGTGRYYAAPVTTVTNTVATDGTITVAGLYLPRRVTLSRIGMTIQSAGSANSVVRLGVWADTGLGEPGALLLDAGTIDGTSTAAQEITISLTTGPGLVWIGGAAQGTPVTPPTYRGRTVGTWIGPSAPSSLSASGLPAQNGYFQAGVAGALPDPFVNGGNTNSSMIVVVKIGA